MTASLVTLARKMMLTPAQAAVLPTAIERAAALADMGEASMTVECMRNAPLAAYIAAICRKVEAETVVLDIPDPFELDLDIPPMTATTW